MIDDAKEKHQNTKIVFGIARFARDAKKLGVTFNFEPTCSVDEMTERLTKEYQCGSWLARAAAQELLKNSRNRAGLQLGEHNGNRS